jgi:hypothetical protein
MPDASGRPSSPFAVLPPGKKCPDMKQDFALGYSGCKDKYFVLLPETQVEVWKSSSQQDQTFLYKVYHEQLR